MRWTPLLYSGVTIARTGGSPPSDPLNRRLCLRNTRARRWWPWWWSYQGSTSACPAALLSAALWAVSHVCPSVCVCMQKGNPISHEIIIISCVRWKNSPGGCGLVGFQHTITQTFMFQLYKKDGKKMATLRLYFNISILQIFPFSFLKTAVFY